MPWNRRRARLDEIQLQRTNGALSTQILQLREQLRNKESYAGNERIDKLTEKTGRRVRAPGRARAVRKDDHRA